MRSYTISIDVEANEPLSGDVPALSTLAATFAASAAANIPVHMDLKGVSVTSYTYDEEADGEVLVGLPEPKAVTHDVPFDPAVDQ